jgi:hypothetical protein
MDLAKWVAKTFGLLKLEIGVGKPGWEIGGDAGHADRGAFRGRDRKLDHVWINDDCSDGWNQRIKRVRPYRFGDHLHHLARGVLPLKRGQIDHLDDQVERDSLGIVLN